MLRLIAYISLLAAATPLLVRAQTNAAKAVVVQTNLAEINAALTNVAKTTLTREGEAAPAFEYTTLDGKKLSLKKLRGKVVLVSFFTIACEPCLDEMPHLEKEVWQEFKDKKFAMVAIGREHEVKELNDFAKRHQLTFPIASDPKRKIYGLFASQHVPRNYVIGADGTIAFQSAGYDTSDFSQMISVIKGELETNN